ncbi:hypothetical protein P4606_19825 [Priestia aryabhattai]|uniref:hypothetical protein n=1 Tax=Priestia aryabhattai TaxID=412384 RepID=UPI002E1D65C8|nr:hypothetical protein [Priestia aryabhattai]
MKKFSPNTEILGTPYFISDFWSWGFSNVLMNSLRGIFSEFLVGSALKVLEKPRVEWDTHDLVYKDKKIEVKSAAYIQSWYRGKHSKISFDIGAKKFYDYNKNSYSVDALRHADIYTFCLLKEKDFNQVNVLNTEQWSFYIVPTQTLNNLHPCQKSISLSTLEKITQPIPYHQIGKSIDIIINKIN